MAEWTPTEVQEGILITLYQQYMEDSRMPVVFSKDAFGENDPDFKDVRRRSTSLSIGDG